MRFMVGIAWWDAGGLQVEQFFMRDLDEEHSLLLELSERMTKRPVLVTFNGKSFDWPLLETRYRMTRAIPAFSPKVHLDLLHPARQLWRLRLGSVRLKDLERHVLGGEGRALDWSRHDDIDSSLIPQMYFDYLRGGPAEPLAGIFRHNQMDLRGLAALAGKILALLDSGNGIANAAHAETHDPIEVFGLSRMMRKRGHSTRARELYETALQFWPAASRRAACAARTGSACEAGTGLHARHFALGRIAPGDRLRASATNRPCSRKTRRKRSNPPSKPPSNSRFTTNIARRSHRAR